MSLALGMGGIKAFHSPSWAQPRTYSCGAVCLSVNMGPVAAAAEEADQDADRSWAVRRVHRRVHMIHPGALGGFGNAGCRLQHLTDSQH